MNNCNVNLRRVTMTVSSAATVALIMIFCIQSKGKQAPGGYSGDLLEQKTLIIEGSNRQKRFIIFNGTGVVKLVLGASFPIMLPDKKRSLNVFYNLQMQYTPPPRPLYWWSFYNTTTFAARKQRSADMLMRYDNSRSSIYQFIETALHRAGTLGSDCLLKVICEMAHAPLTEDNGPQDHTEYSWHELPTKDDYNQNIYHELINAIFTPYLSNVEQRYLDARVAGLKETNCNELFGQCSVVDEWLRNFTRLV